jgi:hypothetical protein
VCALFEVKIKKIENREEYQKKFDNEKKIYYTKGCSVSKKVEKLSSDARGKKESKL